MQTDQDRLALLLAIQYYYAAGCRSFAAALRATYKNIYGHKAVLSDIKKLEVKNTT